MNPVKCIIEHKKEALIATGVVIVAGVLVWKGPALYRNVKTRMSLREKVRKVKTEGPYPEEFMASLNKFHETLDTDKSKDDDSVYQRPTIVKEEPKVSKAEDDGPTPAYIGMEKLMPKPAKYIEPKPQDYNDPETLALMAETAKNLLDDEEKSPEEQLADVPERAYDVYVETDGERTLSQKDFDVEDIDDGFPDFYGQTTLAEALREIRIKNGEEWDFETEEGRAAYQKHYDALPRLVKQILEDPKTQEALDEGIRKIEEEEAKWFIVPDDQAYIAEHNWLVQRLPGQEELYERLGLDEETRALRRESFIRSRGEGAWERWNNWVEPAEQIRRPGDPKPEEKREPEKPKKPTTPKKKATKPKDVK